MIILINEVYKSPNLIKLIPLILFIDLHLSISNDIVSTKIHDTLTTLILVLSISHFQMVMFVALHPIDSIRFARVSSHVADINTRNELLTQRNFLKMAIGIINFAKPFLNFIDLSCAKDFRNLNFMVTWYINLRFNAVR